MTAALYTVVSYAAIPAGALSLGGFAAIVRSPGDRARSYLQHFAAGVVFAAVAVEVLPDVVHRRAPVAASLGFAAGVAAMLAIRAVSRRLGAPAEVVSTPAAGDRSGDPARAALRLLGVVGVDVLVDGILIGVMLAAGRRQGVLVTVALSVEVLSLGAAISATLGSRGTSRARSAAAVLLLAALIIAGALVGAVLLGGRTGAAEEAVLAFSVAALLFLVTEELLVEAHEVPETPVTTATFFVGFLLLLVIDMIA